MHATELRDRFLLQSLEIIEEQGHETLTLRELGARVGVSRQAPYLHFASKQALLAAVAAEVIRRERTLMQAAVN
jgi:AcrR family transcriptional regulator